MFGKNSHVHVHICSIHNMHVHICNMDVQKFEHACSSFEQHAKLASMLTWIFFKIPCSEWNMHIPHVEHGKILCQHAAPFPEGLSAYCCLQLLILRCAARRKGASRSCGCDSKPFCCTWLLLPKRSWVMDRSKTRLRRPAASWR